MKNSISQIDSQGIIHSNNTCHTYRHTYRHTLYSICCGCGPAAPPGPTPWEVVGPGRTTGPPPQARTAARHPRNPLTRGHTTTIIPHSHHPYLIHTTRHRDIQTSFMPSMPHSNNSASILICRARGGKSSRRRGRQTDATTLTGDTNERRERGVC